MKTLVISFGILLLILNETYAARIFCRTRYRRVLPARRVAAQSNARREQPKSKLLTSLGEELFDGQTLKGWTIIEEYDFERHGEVAIKDNAIVLAAGKPATGIRLDRDFPRTNYEVALEAKRIEGSDFFCGITFPVGDSYLSLVLGGWGGGTTGLSNLDSMSAIENATTGFQEFEQNRWYRIRLRVTEARVEAWIDDEQIVDVDHTMHKLSIWWEQEPVRPFGIASWYTTSALRDLRLKRL